jgi:GMP synthase (glutamine-hydrolysing)
MKHAVVIRHLAFEDLGSLDEVLKQKDYVVSYLEAGRDNFAEVAPLTPDLLVILGGPISANDEQDYPFIADEISLVKHRLADDLPTLGICLGAQIMARALGAKVYPGSKKEIGWLPLDLSNAGLGSSLAHLASDKTSMFHWHGDTFDLPNGSILLASTANYENQAFSWGRCGLALQFHPEVTASGLEYWFIGHAGEINATPDLTVGSLREDTARHVACLEKQATRFWLDWLKSVV